jgi:hypothetical protein
MSKFIRWAQNYLLFALPFVLLCMAWGTFQTERQILDQPTFFTKFVWEVLSWNLILWFLVLVAYLILMVFKSEVREKTLKRLANLKERDEREQFITGRASRAAYISTLSLIICLLFFSIFSLNIYHVPESKAVNGKTGTVSIGLSFNLLDQPKLDKSTENKIIFETRDIPVSKTAILLILLIWQLAAFNLAARREDAKTLIEEMT